MVYFQVGDSEIDFNQIKIMQWMADRIIPTKKKPRQYTKKSVCSDKSNWEVDSDQFSNHPFYRFQK